MQIFLYFLLGAIFVLGVLFIQAYRRKGGHPAPATDATNSESYLDTTRESARRVAEAEAASVRQLAQTEAEALRRTVATEVEAQRRAARSDANSLTSAAEAAVAKAERRAEELLAEATRRGELEQTALTEAVRREERDLAQALERQAQQQSELDDRFSRLGREQRELDQSIESLNERNRRLDELSEQLQLRASELDTLSAQRERELERVAGLSADEAKSELLAAVESTSRREAAVLVRTIETEARVEGNARARAIIADSLQRVASEQTTESVVSVLHLPGDDMKGRIIGREGRNIRAFETVTGVNLIIDDTPEAVLLSCFDPVRREVGRLTLEKLISTAGSTRTASRRSTSAARSRSSSCACGPARTRSPRSASATCDEHLLPVLGRLRYRTSYGQNVLEHLIESAHIAGMMAASSASTRPCSGAARSCTTSARR